MSKNTNISLVADGEVLGFPAELGVARINGETIIAGLLNTKGKNPGDFIQNKELGVSGLTNQLTVLPEAGKNFSVSFAKQSDKLAFMLSSSGITCGIMLTGETKQLMLILNTSKLKNGNGFEQAVAEIAEWAKISNLNLIVQNKGGGNASLLKKLSNDFAQVKIPKGFESYQLIAEGSFDLSQTAFGRCVNTLTSLNQLRFAVGGSFAEKNFAAQLIAGRIETDAFIIDNLLFGLKKYGSEFYCFASGIFIFKLENNCLGFTLSGAASTKSFMLSASSLKDARIPLNSRLSFSDLSLSVGVVSGRVSFGMTGRLNTNNLSIFAGFVVSPPTISLFTAALTSTTGRISLKDLVVEIADIQCEAINCLDVVAVEDFDLQNTSLASGINNFPTNNNDEHYEEVKSGIEREVISDFNKKMDTLLQINGDAQLTPLGNNTGQYILTDKENMRHYRIDRKGKISLNCQIYVCTQQMMLGNNEMPVGLFICGTLDIFGVKVRFLFLVNKGKSLVALVQMQKINIHNIFVLSKSNKPLPMEPINGGAAGQLVKPNDDGAIMYLNIQKDKGELTFYLSAHLTILKIFEFDSLVLIKDRSVYINIERDFAGFKTTFFLKGSYGSFATAGFAISIAFDTSGFRQLLEKAQRELQNAAKSVESGVREATRKLDEAQQNVLSLQRKIDDFNNRIYQCERDISDAHWYEIGTKIARGVEIVCLGIAKAGVYVAIGIAYGALEIAKAALKLGGMAVSSILNSLAYVINAVTQVLWIKSFELGITATPEAQKVKAELVLTVFGQDITLGGELNLAGLIDNIKNFVSGGIGRKSNELIDDIKNGRKVTRAIGSDLEIDASFVMEYCDLTKNKERYEELSQLRDAVEYLFIDSNNAYFDAYKEENPDARENACNMTKLRWEEEIFHDQHSDAFDDEFVQSLDTVIQTIRQEKEVNRASVSDKMEAKMDNLLNLVHSVNEQKENRVKRAKERESLFSRLEKNTEQKQHSMRSRAAEAEINAEEANARYANDLSRLVDQHLGGVEGEAAEELRRTIGIAIYQFNNPNDTFRKQNNSNENNEEDEEDF